MAADGLVHASAATVALVALALALQLSAAVSAPVACALLVVAIVRPLQAALERVLPSGLALLLTLACCLAAAALLLGAVAWGLGRAAAWLVANADRLQLLDERGAGWSGWSGRSSPPSSSKATRRSPPSCSATWRCAHS